MDIEVKQLNLRKAGMFSNVNELVQQLFLAEEGQYVFHINWRRSCYRQKHRKEDPWLYYFEECFDLGDQTNLRNLERLPGGPIVACKQHNIITPRKIDGRCNTLLLPVKRELPHRIIQQYIHVKPAIQAIVDAFLARHQAHYLIGLHIRGPGRTTSGLFDNRSRYPTKRGIPFRQYFASVEQKLLEESQAKILACSDSEFVLREIRNHFGSRVIQYSSTTSEYGELHASHPKNAGFNLDPYKLGEDVLVEALLLTQVDYFVHGLSNLVNFVLCKNPTIDSKYVLA